MHKSFKSIILLFLLISTPAIQCGTKLDTALDIAKITVVSLGVGLYLHNHIWPSNVIMDKVSSLKNYLFSVSKKEQEKVCIGFITIDLNKHTAWDCIIPLEYLMGDKTIKAVVLIIQGSDSSYGISQAIVQMMHQLKKAYPKPVIAYCDDSYLMGSQYFLACVADNIMVSSATWVGGIDAFWNLKEIHEKNQEDGIEYHFIHKGRFKALGVPGVQQTQEYRDAAQEYCDSLYKHIIAQLSTLRPVLPQDTKTWASGKFVAADEALGLHLVDKVCDKSGLFKDLFERLDSTFDPKRLEPIITMPAPLPYYKKVVGESLDQKIGIGLLRISDLEKKSSWDYTQSLEALFSDNQVKGVALAIDGDGCCVALGTALHNDILMFKSLYKKPVVAYIEHMALSGTYLIASAADHIIATSSSQVGYIGVCLEQFDNTKKNAKEHVAYTTLKSAEDLYPFSADEPLTPQKREILQKMVDTDYEQSKGMIKKARPALAHNEEKWCEAQRYIGADALSLGLIDQLGSPFDAFNYIKHAVGYPVEETINVENIDLIIRNTDVRE